MCSWVRFTNGSAVETDHGPEGRYERRAVVIRFTVRTSSWCPGISPTVASWVPTRGASWSMYWWNSSNESLASSQRPAWSTGQFSDPQLADARGGATERSDVKASSATSAAKSERTANLLL